MASINPPLIVLLGPTAVGKTELSLALCEQFYGEIVGADSRQIYRGMDIGTAKPTLADRARAPHHLIPKRMVVRSIPMKTAYRTLKTPVPMKRDCPTPTPKRMAVPSKCASPIPRL